MAVYVNLGKALISQVLINGVLQRIEFKYLPTMCFSCSHYGHSQDLCPKQMNEQQGAKEIIVGTERGYENKQLWLIDASRKKKPAVAKRTAEPQRRR
ncbi:hypothetical protein J1N35_011505 [Gossypium stocksii]|uniref:Zinc knuckle CX2CX4HX4C domain-containing protein n=1 Tax=Gossypium stocksii TaxID=47602 RepID=A0A9D3W2U8_9ROSI|nr:hypothetical protein J1N35_011505 [Gossypium stocksii]